MQVAFYKDLYSLIMADADTKTACAPDPIKARRNLASRDEDYPYIVYSGKFINDSNESGDALGTAYITLNIYDYSASAKRCLAICRALKRLLNRKWMSHMPEYTNMRLYLVSHINIPTNRDDVMREELIFKARYYDNSTAEMLYVEES